MLGINSIALLIGKGEHDFGRPKELADGQEQLPETALGERDDPFEIRPRRRKRIKEERPDELKSIEGEDGGIEEDSKDGRLKPIRGRAARLDRDRVVVAPVATAAIAVRLRHGGREAGIEATAVTIKLRCLRRCS